MGILKQTVARLEGARRNKTRILVSSPYREASIAALRDAIAALPEATLVDHVSSGRRSIVAGLFRRLGLRRLSTYFMYCQKFLFDARVSVAVLLYRPNHVVCMWGSARLTFMAARMVGSHTALNYVNAHPAAHNEVLLNAGVSGRHPELVPSWASRWISAEAHTADLVIVPSRLLGMDLRNRGVSASRILVAPYGSNFPAGAGHQDMLKVEKRTSLPVNALYVGQISERKGLPTLLREAGDILNLTAIGPVVSLEVASLVSAHHQLVDTLSQAELAKQYEIADMFVFPSLEDTFGLVVLEAMSHGCICVVSSRAGASELITHGVNGFVADPGPAFRRAILVASKSSSAVGEAARVLAAEYSWERFTRTVLTALEIPSGAAIGID